VARSAYDDNCRYTQQEESETTPSTKIFLEDKKRGPSEEWWL
jgi:hypothetical protein